MFHQEGISLIFWSQIQLGWNESRSTKGARYQGHAPPEDVTQLRSFLGAVNFMHPFIPHLSTNTAPLRALLEKNAIFQWTPSTNTAFEKLKALIINAEQKSLKFYNRNLPILVQADASKIGLGAALLQEGQPIAFASKSLSDAEKMLW